MILLMDLIQSPTGSTASESRTVIDVIFALCSPSGGLIAGAGIDRKIMKRPLTEGGKEAWETLRRLRIKAWQKADLDPDIMWTREQALQHCAASSEPVVNTSPDWPQDPSGTSSAAPEMQGYEAIGDMMMSPQNIDWSYVDAVLEGNQMDLDLGLGQPEPGEGIPWRPSPGEGPS